MSQLIYSILALSVVVLFSTSLNRSFTGSGQKTYTNEVLSQMIGVGQDIMEDVGRRSLPFDEEVDEDRYEGPIVYPLVRVAWQLTHPDSASWGECSWTADFSPCLDLDDFHGKTVYRTVDSLDYEATITVQYVDELDPTVISATRTFAKMVTVEVSSESIRVGDEPLTVAYSRVFTYERSTDPAPSTVGGGGGGGGGTGGGGTDG